jgi:hydrogenase maturation protease
VTVRIICVGSRLAESDAAGPRVHDVLAGKAPADVEVIDGGLMGLDLLPLMEGASQIIFVDAMEGADGESVYVLDGIEAGGTLDDGYGHGGGLAYLLRMLPHVWEGTMPEIRLVGVAGCCDDERAEEVAALCLDLARGGASRKAGTERKSGESKHG